MIRELRICVTLLVLTVGLCSVLYPVSLWAVGKTLFPHQSQGGLVDELGQPTTATEQAVGARLIAQPFSGDEYYQPRPSAAAFNASASAGSNWGPGNYLLRDRVARQLGPLVKYRSGPEKGQLVGPDIEAWFAKDRIDGKVGIVAEWARRHSAVVTSRVKAEPAWSEHVAAWMKENPEVIAKWKSEQKTTKEPNPEDVASAFFTDFSKRHPGAFLTTETTKEPDGKSVTKVRVVKGDKDVQGTFFDLWLQDQADVVLEPVPADMVTASGSGLDPHITLQSAHYQTERVAQKWATELKRELGDVQKELEAMLQRHKSAPLFGLVGVELINVLELNLEVSKTYRPKGKQ